MDEQLLRSDHMIRIIVDSASDYLPRELEEKNVSMVPLQMSFGPERFLDNVDISREEFYNLLTTRDDFPVTSQPSPEAFLKFFLAAKGAGDEVICITISSALSGTFQSAVIAGHEAEYDQIYLVDSMTASVGVQFLGDLACRMRDEGKGVSEIVEALELIRGKIRVCFMVDTLEYLYRGGRLSRTGAKAGELVNMKPLLTLDEEGNVKISDLCLGTSRAIKMMARRVKMDIPDSEFPVYSLYSSGTENCEKLEEQLSKNQISFFTRRQIGAVIGSHIGPGAAGVFYVKSSGGESYSRRRSIDGL